MVLLETNFAHSFQMVWIPDLTSLDASPSSEDGEKVGAEAEEQGRTSLVQVGFISQIMTRTCRSRFVR